MPKNNSEQKEKPLAGISLRMACGSKMDLFLFAVTLIFLKVPLQMFISEFRSCSSWSACKNYVKNVTAYMKSKMI